MRILLLPFILFFFCLGANAQLIPVDQPVSEREDIRPTPSPAPVFDPALRPFYHGVASGDPMADRVIIWTRVTPDMGMASIPVTWEMATDSGMVNVVQNGTFTTTDQRDFTVKIDVTGLQSNTTYFYRFTALGLSSIVGRTKTAPQGNEENHLRFAVVSCQNYQAGYFNAHARIGERNDLAAVIHLGDYIYEYPGFGYGDTTLVDRQHDTLETVSLAQYRTRYSLYRLDRDLMRNHQQHPFVCIWDDHESANNAWFGGAQNHTPGTEGDWSLRKSVAKQAYFEWQPIRDNADTSIYRVLQYGDLCDLIMLDTRLEGREQQILDVTDPALYDPARTLLGIDQKSWFRNALNNSTARWKVVGNQVIFAEFVVGWLGPIAGQTPESAESTFLDIWDGYPQERLELIHFLDSAAIDNTVFVTGDVHSSFAFDVADTVCNPAANYAPVPNYDRLTGAGSKAVEFVAPSVTSANFDENVGPAIATVLEGLLTQPIAGAPNNYANPHLKFTDLDRHGYVLLDLRPDSAQGDWFFVDRIDAPSLAQSFGAAQFTRNGENHLNPANAPAPPKAVQDVPAPLIPFTPNGLAEAQAANGLLLGMHPNPVSDQLVIQYALRSAAPVKAELYDVQGRLVSRLFSQNQSAGVFQAQCNLGGLASGVYLLRLQVGNEVKTGRVVKR